MGINVCVLPNSNIVPDGDKSRFNDFGSWVDINIPTLMSEYQLILCVLKVF